MIGKCFVVLSYVAVIMGPFPDVWVNLIIAGTNAEGAVQKLFRCKRYSMFDSVCSLTTVQLTFQTYHHTADRPSPTHCQQQAKQRPVYKAGQFITKVLDFIMMKHDNTELQNDTFLVN
jgi:hypothetical protein